MFWHVTTCSSLDEHWMRNTIFDSFIFIDSFLFYHSRYICTNIVYMYVLTCLGCVFTTTLKKVRKFSNSNPVSSVLYRCWDHTLLISTL